MNWLAVPTKAEPIQPRERRLVRFQFDPGEGTPLALRSSQMLLGDSPAAYRSKTSITTFACSGTTTCFFLLSGSSGSTGMVVYP